MFCEMFDQFDRGFTMVRGGVAAVYFLNIQSKRFVALMNEIVASMMILFSTMFRSLLPNRSKLHSASESNFFYV